MRVTGRGREKPTARVLMDIISRASSQLLGSQRESLAESHDSTNIHVVASETFEGHWS
jgi:hypothetical protein